MNNQSFEENNFKELLKNNPDRQKEIARSGGIASGISRRKKSEETKALKSLLDVAFMIDFASPEELKEFRKWKKHHKKR